MEDTEPAPPTTSSTQAIAHKDTPNPLFSLFSNFLQTLNFPLLHAFFNFPPPKVAATKQEEKSVSVTLPTNEEAKVGTVKFPDSRPAVFPLKLESEELERDTNPVVLWQVYAIGGFFVLRWAWARWNERRGKKRPSDDDPAVADD
ncbi:hypothetical protein LguiA_016730 [Lonicera macranthoides]